MELNKIEKAPQGAATPENGNSKKSSKRLRVFSMLLMLALIAVTLYVIFRETSLGEIWSAVQSCDRFGLRRRLARPCLPR